MISWANFSYFFREAVDMTRPVLHGPLPTASWPARFPDWPTFSGRVLLVHFFLIGEMKEKQLGLITLFEEATAATVAYDLFILPV